MPRREMSNLDYSELQRELDPLLAGAHLNKVYELRPGLFRLRFRTKDAGRADLLVELGVRAHLTRRLEQAPASPTSFAALLRARLGNARVLGVEQVNRDRVLRLRVSTKDGERSLVLELMRPGNLVLLGEGGKIVDVYEPKAFAARTLKHGEHYLPPPASAKRTEPRRLELPREPGESFSQALDRFYAEPATAEVPAADKALTRERARINRALSVQRQALEQQEVHYREQQRMGQALFAHAAEVECALELARENPGLSGEALGGLILRETGLRARRVKDEFELEIPAEE